MALLLICEKNTDIAAPGKYDQILLWSDLAEEGNITSIPRTVDNTFDYIRDLYLGWLAGIGNTAIRGKRLVEYFAVRHDFSMWWMSLLVEKSQWKSPRLYDVFRLLAYDGVMRDMQLTQLDQIEIAVKDRSVEQALVLWCVNSGIEYVLRPKKRQIKVSVKLIFSFLPYIAQGVIYLVSYLYNCLTVRSASTNPHGDNEGKQYSFITYFFNNDLECLENGIYKSRYWTALYDLLRDQGKCHNWLHIFVKSKDVKTPKHASNLVAKLNSNASGCETHKFLDQRVNASDIITIVRDYLKICVASFRVRSVTKSGFNIEGTSISLWPLLARDWKDSFVGKTAMENLLYINKFEKAVSNMPHQEKGFYLLENQGWERALIYAWRSAGHGPITGVQHSTVNACDLRHFLDPSEYSNKQPYSIPVPDQIAVNGDAAMLQLLNSGFPKEKLVAAEGLRYLYLCELAPSTVAVNKYDGLRLLVLGDYLPDVTYRQMQLLSDAADRLPPNMTVMVKSHPACPIDAADWPLLKLTMLDGALDQLVKEYDVAFTSNITAAAVDAYLSGKYVLSMLDAETFNMSPLRGFSGVSFISSPEELIGSLYNLDDMGEVAKEGSMNHYFYTDASLPRWTKLLN